MQWECREHSLPWTRRRPRDEKLVQSGLGPARVARATALGAAEMPGEEAGEALDQASGEER